MLISVVLVSIVFHNVCPYIETQKYAVIQNCNDRYVVEHQNRNLHAYCWHACNKPSNSTNAECRSTGNCVCSPPCYEGKPVKTSGKGDFCPARRISHDDLVKYEARCRDQCNIECPGSDRSVICGENESAAKVVGVCTCYCAPQMCPTTTTTPTTTITEITTTTPTTEPTPTTTTALITTTTIATRPTVTNSTAPINATGINLFTLISQASFKFVWESFCRSVIFAISISAVISDMLLWCILTVIVLL